MDDQVKGLCEAHKSKNNWSFLFLQVAVNKVKGVDKAVDDGGLFHVSNFLMVNEVDYVSINRVKDKKIHV